MLPPLNQACHQRPVTGRRGPIAIPNPMRWRRDACGEPRTARPLVFLTDFATPRALTIRYGRWVSNVLGWGSVGPLGQPPERIRQNAVSSPVSGAALHMWSLGLRVQP